MSTKDMLQVLIKGQEALQTRYDSLQKGQDALQIGFDSLQKKQDILQTRYDSLQEGQGALQNGFNSLQKGQDTIHTRYDLLQKGYLALQEGQKELKEEIVTLREEMRDGFRETHERLDKQGMQLAYLEDDAPTRAEHEGLVKRVQKIEKTRI